MLRVSTPKTEFFSEIIANSSFNEKTRIGLSPVMSKPDVPR
jgi:hypothetical protein